MSVETLLPEATLQPTGGSSSAVARMGIAWWVLPLFLTILVPGLHRQAEQWLPAFRGVRYLNATVIVSIAAIALMGVVWLLGVRSGRRSLSLTAAGTFVLFSWPLFTAIGRAFSGGVPWMVDAVPVLVASGLIALALRLGEERVFAAAFSALIVVVLAAVGLPLLAAMRATATDPGIPTPVSAVEGSQPDVVVLVVDAYARGDVLESMYGFDNAPFEGALAASGFSVVPDAASSYTSTFASVSSMLSLDHPLATGPVDEGTRAMVRRILSGDNAFFAAFAGAGYETWMLESYWDGLNCGPAVDHCERIGLTSGSLWDLAGMTIFRPVVHQLVAHPAGPQAIEVLDRVAELAGDRSAVRSPRLVFAHVHLPHPPFNITADCSTVVDSSRGGLGLVLDGMPAEQLAERRAYYVAQVECLNARVLDVVAEAGHSGRETIVLVTADHGPDSHGQLVRPPSAWEDGALLERFGIFLALRLAEMCPEVLPTSPVNATRAVVDCALGTQLGPIADRHLATSTAQPVGLHDVTEAVRQVTAQAGPVAGR